MVKLYKNLVNSVAGTLQEIFVKNKQADKALEKLFKANPQWGSRDRRFVAEAVYDVVRYYRLYSELAESKNNFWFITAVWLVDKQYTLPEWQEFRDVDPERIRKAKEALRKQLPVFESYPDWFWDMGTKELGEERWLKEALAMNKTADLVIRANTLKITPAKLSERLSKENIDHAPIPEVPSALKILKRQNLFQHTLFKEGCFEVQDAGSQMIGDFVKPKNNDLIIDACAGAGGKSLHLAALMQNKGKIISMDVEEWKLEELKKRAKRGGVHNIETRKIESDHSIEALKDKADKVLLDVPCSGTGVLKRNPDAKWKLNPESIERTKQLQKEILEKYSQMVKRGGQLIYSTCSILPSENHQQVIHFLESHPDFNSVEEKTIYPSDGTDGFYMSRLVRKV